jgi:hypothetical protein
VDKPAECTTDVDLGRQLSGRYVARRAAERGYELPSRNADCHLPRPRWVHAPLQCREAYHGPTGRSVTHFTVL